jgi:hypothetical protein
VKHRQFSSADMASVAKPGICASQLDEMDSKERQADRLGSLDADADAGLEVTPLTPGPMMEATSRHGVRGRFGPSSDDV